jgi:hypothetical protein
MQFPNDFQCREEEIKDSIYAGFHVLTDYVSGAVGIAAARVHLSTSCHPAQGLLSSVEQDDNDLRAAARGESVATSCRLHPVPFALVHPES